MNLGKTWMCYILKDGNKMGKEGNVSIKIKYIRELKKRIIKKKKFI